MEEIYVDKQFIYARVKEKFKTPFLTIFNFLWGNAKFTATEARLERKLNYLRRRVESPFENFLERNFKTRLDITKKCYEIHLKKAKQLFMLVQMMAGDYETDCTEVFKELDIEVCGDMVRKSDVDRVVTPLYTNYKKVRQMIEQGNALVSLKMPTEEDLLKQLKIPSSNYLPSEDLLESIFEEANAKDESIPLTEAQKKHIAIERKDFGKSLANTLLTSVENNVKK